MKSFDNFSAVVVVLYDAIQAAVEDVEDNTHVTYPELMCVLSSLLCNAAVEMGLGREEFLAALMSNYDHVDGTAVPSGVEIH